MKDSKISNIKTSISELTNVVFPIVQLTLHTLPYLLVRAHQGLQLRQLHGDLLLQVRLSPLQEGPVTVKTVKLVHPLQKPTVEASLYPLLEQQAPFKRLVLVL